MNKLANILLLKTYFKHCISLIFIICSINIQAQEITYNTGEKYVLGDVTVLGNSSFSDQTIITYSGLSKGKEITIPGEEISNAIKKLWNSKLFSDIEIYVTKIEDKVAYLQIRLSDLPELNEIKVNGVKKGKIDGIVKDNKLIKGVKVTENLITNTKNFLETKYKKEVTAMLARIEKDLQKFTK